MGKRWLAPAVLAGAVLALAACGSNNSPSSGSSTPATTPTTSAPATSAPAATGTTIMTGKAGGATVLTNAKGLTLYWFAPDTPTKSNCNGQCATFWPPVPGPATAGLGVKASKFGTLKRSDGSTQASYGGHPLYTYVGDHAPGQATGNGKNLSGGVWHDIPLTGGAKAASSQSGSVGGGGY